MITGYSCADSGNFHSSHKNHNSSRCFQQGTTVAQMFPASTGIGMNSIGKSIKNYGNRCRESSDSWISGEVMEVQRGSGLPWWRNASGDPEGAPSSETQRRVLRTPLLLQEGAPQVRVPRINPDASSDHLGIIRNALGCGAKQSPPAPGPFGGSNGHLAYLARIMPQMTPLQGTS